MATQFSSVTASGNIDQAGKVNLNYSLNATAIKMTDAAGKVIRDSIGGKITATVRQDETESVYNTITLTQGVIDAANKQAVLVGETKSYAPDKVTTISHYIVLHVKEVEGKREVGYALMEADVYKSFADHLPHNSPDWLHVVSTFYLSPTGTQSVMSRTL